MLNTIIESLVDILTVAAILAPVEDQVIKFTKSHVHNQRVKTLLDRSQVIVKSLENIDVPNQTKNADSVDKLMTFANEAGIRLTKQQANDYIEAAVRDLNNVQRQINN